MRGAAPEEPVPPAGSGPRVPRVVRARKDATPPARRVGPEGAPETDRAVGEDEILRSGSASGGRGAKSQASAEKPAHTAGLGERRRTPEPAGEAYAGWLPSGRALTGREVAISALIAEALFAALLVLLTVAERWAALPEPVGGYEIPLTLSAGLLCGLYVLLRLRARRLAWRRQLTGEGP